MEVREPIKPNRDDRTRRKAGPGNQTKKMNQINEETTMELLSRKLVEKAGINVDELVKLLVKNAAAELNQRRSQR